MKKKNGSQLAREFYKIIKPMSRGEIILFIQCAVIALRDWKRK